MSRPLAIAPSQVVSRIVVRAVVALAAVLAAPRPALANGAFPESYQIVLPADRPQQILLATNFGLIISDDGGASWTWTCEQAATMNATLYGVSPSPSDRLFAASTAVGLSYSDDGSCTWRGASGSLDTALATDYFVDPTNAMRVYAVAAPAGAFGMPSLIVASDDGGTTFGAPLFTAPAGVQVVSVESARSDPKTIYVAAYETSGFHPLLERSTDGGATWTPVDVEPSLGASNFRIVAVDPDDAKVVTVRVFETTGDSLAVSRDGGQTFTKVLTTTGQLTGYVRLASGTILVSAAEGTEGVGFRSTDGMTYAPWTPRTESDAGVPDVASDGGAPRAPHIRALAARGGKLYAAAKNYSDDWAIGVSTDDGATFERLMRYGDVRAVRACAQSLCQESCDYQASVMALWPKTVCGPAAPASASGCGCGVGGSFAPLGVAALCGAVVLAASRRRRR